MFIQTSNDGEYINLTSCVSKVKITMVDAPPRTAGGDPGGDKKVPHVTLTMWNNTTVVLEGERAEKFTTQFRNITV